MRLLQEEVNKKSSSLAGYDRSYKAEMRSSVP